MQVNGGYFQKLPALEKIGAAIATLQSYEVTLNPAPSQCGQEKLPQAFDVTPKDSYFTAVAGKIRQLIVHYTELTIQV